jgi:DNA-binding MarR family transcriptional regulator
MRARRDTPTDLFFLFKRAHHQLSVYAARSVSEATGVPAGQVAALVHLQQRNGVLIRELGDQLGLNSAGITGLVARLERAGFIRRAPDPRDKRGISVHITKRGRATVARVAPILTHISQQMTEGMTATQVATLDSFFRAIFVTFQTPTISSQTLRRAPRRRQA